MTYEEARAKMAELAEFLVMSGSLTTTHYFAADELGVKLPIANTVVKITLGYAPEEETMDCSCCPPPTACCPSPWQCPQGYYVAPRMGWICPLCGAANSPDVEQCPCVERREIASYPVITCGTLNTSGFEGTITILNGCDVSLG